MSEQSKLISAKIEIAGRLYPIKVSNDELDLIRNIAQQVNEKVRSFRRAYPSKDIQDCLAMALLTYAVDQSIADEPQEKVAQKINEAHSILDRLIHP